MVGSAEISGLYDGTLVNASTVGSIPLGLGWQPVDVGTFALRASQTPPPQGVQWGVTASGCNVDLAGFVCLPDNATWFMAGGQAPFFTSIGWADTTACCSTTLRASNSRTRATTRRALRRLRRSRRTRFV